MKKIWLFLLILLWSHLSYSQDLRFDTSGRVVEFSTEKVSNIDVIKFPSARPYKAELIKLFSTKIQATLDSFRSNKSVSNFYGQLWTDSVTTTVTADLKKINAWLKDEKRSKRKDTIKVLTPLFNALKQALEGSEMDWFQINDNPFNKVIVRNTLLTDDATRSYILQLQVKDKINLLLSALFDSTYHTSSNIFNSLSEDDYQGKISAALKALAERSDSLSKPVNEMTNTDVAAFNQFRASVRSNVVVKSLKEAPYFKNWIWLRESEPVLNPFEIKAKDTARGIITGLLSRDGAIDISDSISFRNHVINRLAIPKAVVRGEKNASIYLPENEMTWSEERPIRGDEKLKIYIYNVRNEESFYFRRIKDSAHSGLNETISEIDSAVNTVARFYKLLSPGASWVSLILESSAINKSGGTSGLADENQSKQKAIDSLKNLFIKSNSFNQYLFDSTLQIPSIAGLTDGNNVREGFISKFYEKYKLGYIIFHDKYEAFKIDSLIASKAYAMVYESNLPPEKLEMKRDDESPIYQTSILETKKVNKDVVTDYEIRRVIIKDSQADTSSFSYFSVKSGQLKQILVSTGFVFTVADRNYGINTFTPRETPGTPVSTTTKNISWTVGLNIYFKRINMLDNHWFASKECPFVSRLSLYLGLDIPDVTKHFYPGVSYDLVPGFKATVGHHFYRYTKFELANNAIVKQGDALGHAGFFFGLNIDPSVVLRVINIFKQ